MSFDPLIDQSLQSRFLNGGWSEFSKMNFAFGCDLFVYFLHPLTHINSQTNKSLRRSGLIWLCCSLSATAVGEPISCLTGFLRLNAPVLQTCQVSGWRTRHRKTNINAWHSSSMAIILREIVIGLWLLMKVDFYFIPTHSALWQSVE